MAFPGGRRSRADDTLFHTTVRETKEETGVDLARYGRQLGRLDAVRPESVRLPALTTLPFVFSVLGVTTAVAASAEVKRTFWIPISHFRDPSTEITHRLDMDGRILSFPALGVTGGIVWRITRRILRNLLGYRA